MPKFTYLLINTENMGHATPMAVSGYSGKLYGHATFDAKLGAHTFRVTQEEWESGMDLDIAKGMHRRLQRWRIRVEVVDDAPVAAVAEVPEVPPFSSVVPPMDELPAPSDTPSEFSGTPPSMPMPDLNLHPKTLDKLCRDEGVEVSEPRTKVKMRAALTEHYSKAAA